jgi:microsomal dipeptidase-like Zn-dependent dipeptidase
MENNKDGYDVIGLLASLQDWPEETHNSRLQRALYQAEKLQDRVRSSEGAMQMITNRSDLASLMTARQQGKPVIGALLSLEGAHALEGDPENIDILYDAGFRMLGLVHLMDNDMAGSAHGVDQHGLTDKGRVMLQRAVALGMVIDLAHASPQTIYEVLQVVDRPVVASHGGVRGTCDTARNLADHHIQSIAATGGVIGIGLYEYATCGKSIDDTVRAIHYVADLVGIEHVALGSDFDGATETHVDATGLVLLTEALQKVGYSHDDIRAIMGNNALRVLRKTLP